MKSSQTFVFHIFEREKDLKRDNSLYFRKSNQLYEHMVKTCSGFGGPIRCGGTEAELSTHEIIKGATATQFQLNKL